MYDILTIASIAVIVLGGYYAMTIPFLFIVLPIAGYKQIRRYGYSPGMGTILVLGVLLSAVLATIATVMLVPTPHSAWGDFVIVLLCIAEPISFSALGYTALVRKLPKHELRVSGPRRVRFPFVFFGYLVITVGILGVAAVPILAPTSSRTISNLIGLAPAVTVFALVGKALIAVGRRIGSQQSIEQAVHSKAKQPVLFLRPFAVERVPFVQGPSSKYDRYSSGTQQLMTAVGRTSDVDGNKREEDPTISIAFEVYFGRAFRERIGPLVALGNPEDYLPPEGATRTYLDDEGWYEYFERIARQAVCIVMPMSNSDNLQRELIFLRREGLQRRLFIFTPLWSPTKRRGPFPARATNWVVSKLYGITSQPSHSAGWRQLDENLRKVGFDLGEDPGQGAVVTFDAEGKSLMLVSEGDTPSDFIEPLRNYLLRTFELDFGWSLGP